MDFAGFASAKEGTMKAIFRSRSSPIRSGRQWAIAAATGLALALSAMIVPTPASAVDINGIINTAIALHYARIYARLPGHHPGGHVAAKRDSDDDDDDGGSGRSGKSAASGSHNPSPRPAHGMHEAAPGGASSEAMVSLDRSLEGPDSSHSR
jgi:hypothetical protein